MGWMEQLESMESNEENKKAERKVEGEQIKNEIETKEDLEEKIQDILNGYETLKKMEEMGIDIGDSKTDCQDRIKKIIEDGINKALITQDEVYSLYEKAGINYKNENEQPVKAISEQQIGKATIDVPTSEKDIAKEQDKRNMQKGKIQDYKE